MSEEHDSRYASQLDSFIESPLNAFGWPRPSLYVGGQFTTIDGLTRRRLAAYNGTAFSEVGSGITNGRVYALAGNRTRLYVGGTFTSPYTRFMSFIPGETTFRNSTLVSPLNDTVWTIAANGDKLHLGGAWLTTPTAYGGWYIEGASLLQWQVSADEFATPFAYAMDQYVAAVYQGKALYGNVPSAITDGRVPSLVTDLPAWQRLQPRRDTADPWGFVDEGWDVIWQNGLAPAGDKLYAVSDGYFVNSRLWQWNGSQWDVCNDTGGLGDSSFGNAHSVFSNYIQGVAYAGGSVYVFGNYLTEPPGGSAYSTGYDPIRMLCRWGPGEGFVPVGDYSRWSNASGAVYAACEWFNPTNGRLYLVLGGESIVDDDSTASLVLVDLQTYSITKAGSFDNAIFQLHSWEPTGTE